VNIEVGPTVYLYNFSCVLSTDFELGVLRVVQHVSDILEQQSTLYCQYLKDGTSQGKGMITMTSGPLLEEPPQMPLELKTG